MDKNTIIGFVLMIVVVLAFSWFTQPSQEEIAYQRQYNDSIAAVEAKAAMEAQLWQQQADSMANLSLAGDSLQADSVERARLISEFGAFAPVAKGEEEIVTIENDVLALEFSTRGGYLRRAMLKDYKNYDSTNVVLFEGSDNSYGFLFKTGARVIDTRTLYFTPTISEADNSVNMGLTLADGATWNMRYTLPEGSYRLQMEIEQKGMEKVIPANAVTLDMYWDMKMRRQEKGRMFEERNSALYYKYTGDDVENLSTTGNDDKYATTSLKWIGYKDQFFSTVFIADNNFNEASFTSEVLENDPTYLKELHTETLIDYSPDQTAVGNFSIFLGPNDYKLFRSYDKGADKADKLDLDRMIPDRKSVV